jgi:uncharacterized protein YndB with AHSA1/START domain
VDAVFKALADKSRRKLLDELRRKDGQTLGALERRLPAMTRFGVMKHLAVLEKAGLVVTKRRGREKLHFLNTVPIRQVHDRWVSRFAAKVAGDLVRLKEDLEKKEGTMEKVFEIYIKTTPERLWEALTNPEMRAKYTFGIRVRTDGKKGSPYVGEAGGTTVNPGMKIMEGENLEVEPPRRLVQSLRALWSDDVKREGTSRVTYEIEPIGDSCRLRVTHGDLREGGSNEIYGGWPQILSGLKTLLETGGTLTTPGSLMYQQQGPQPTI